MREREKKVITHNCVNVKSGAQLFQFSLKLHHYFELHVTKGARHVLGHPSYSILYNNIKYMG